MGSVALLSREGEVVIAKKIEGAENKILKNILDINMGIQALQQTAEAFVAGEIRMKSWIKGFDDDEASNNEEIHEAKIKLSTEEFLETFKQYVELFNKKSNAASHKQKLSNKKEEVYEKLKSLNINRKLMLDIINRLATMQML